MGQFTDAAAAVEASIDTLAAAVAALSERVAALEAEPEPEPEPAPPWPGPDNTGPRVPVDQLTPSPAITTTADGQVIERLDVQTRIRIQHSNVTVRDCRVKADGPDGVYPIHIRPNPTSGVVPTGVVIEYVEVAGQPGVGLGPPAVYSAQGNWTLRYADIHDVGSGPRMANNCTVEYCWMHDTATTDPSEHKSGIGLNGGAHNVVRGNVVECSAAGCSAALALYGSYAPVDDILVEGNLFNTTGSYGVYGGSVSSKAYPEGTNIRFLNNRFGRKFNAECGIYGPVTSWDGGNTGNVWAGNVWDDTGEPIVI